MHGAGAGELALIVCVAACTHEGKIEIGKILFVGGHEDGAALDSGELYDSEIIQIP